MWEGKRCWGSRDVPRRHLSISQLSKIPLSLLMFLVGYWAKEAHGTCTNSSDLVGFTADFSMLQHQLRGSFEIVDDCTFRVTRFDMLQGPRVYWWGAESEALADMLDGEPLSVHPLNLTYNSSVMEVSFAPGSMSWEDIKVVAVWSQDTASDYGHILLQYMQSPPPFPPASHRFPPPRLRHRHHPPAANIEFSPAPAPAPSPTPPTLSSLPSPSIVSFPTPLKRGAQQPTMFDNCMKLNPKFRVRWTLNKSNGTVDIGLEADVADGHYLAFGWASPGETSRLMGKADIVVAGFDAEEVPFADDYFVTSYDSCDILAQRGVCPDEILAGNISANNVRLIHAQRLDGITLIRYQRPLVSPDSEWDHDIDSQLELSVIWATGSLHVTTEKDHRSLPSYHGAPPGSAYGMTVLTLGEDMDDCRGPLSPAVPSPGHVVVADRGTSITIISGNSIHYPNPPSPGKSLYLNGREAPVLKVERGVPLQFSIQAGFDLPLYITSDPVGGNTNTNETIFAGGPLASGVPANPYLLPWTPNSSTPDQVYYQAYTQAKMGWLVQVVDGGLSDMYMYTVKLADNKVTLFWTLSSEGILSMAVRCERPSGWLSLGLGGGMVNSFAYVGWIEDGVGSVNTYWIDGRDASSIHPMDEELSMVKATSTDGMLTFEFSRPLHPTKCGKKCNVIDPLVPLKVVWAYGNTWTSGTLTGMNMHTAMSSAATLVNLVTGDALEEHLQPVFAVHGFMMFTSWGVLLPFGVLAARYLKHNDWFSIHLYTQGAGITVMMLGLLFAMGELQGFDFSSVHSRVGISAILLGLWQPFNAYFRPPKANPPERPKIPRLIWQWIHILSGRAALFVGMVALISGILTLGEKSSDEYKVSGFAWGIVAWFAAIGGLVAYKEYSDSKRTTREGLSASPDWRNGGGHQITVLGDDEDDDDVDGDDVSRDLLPNSREPFHSSVSHTNVSGRGSEVELEAIR